MRKEQLGERKVKIKSTVITRFSVYSFCWNATVLPLTDTACSIYPATIQRSLTMGGIRFVQMSALCCWLTINRCSHLRVFNAKVDSIYAQTVPERLLFNSAVGLASLLLHQVGKYSKCFFWGSHFSFCVLTWRWLNVIFVCSCELSFHLDNNLL